MATSLPPNLLDDFAVGEMRQCPLRRSPPFIVMSPDTALRQRPVQVIVTDDARSRAGEVAADAVEVKPDQVAGRHRGKVAGTSTNLNQYFYGGGCVYPAAERHQRQQRSVSPPRPHPCRPGRDGPQPEAMIARPAMPEATDAARIPTFAAVNILASPANARLAMNSDIVKPIAQRTETPNTCRHVARSGSVAMPLETAAAGQEHAQRLAEQEAEQNSPHRRRRQRRAARCSYVDAGAREREQGNDEEIDRREQRVLDQCLLHRLEGVTLVLSNPVRFRGHVVLELQKHPPHVLQVRVLLDLRGRGDRERQ